MIALGLVLVVVGVLLAYLIGDQLARIAGIVLVAVGLLLIILAVIPSDSAEAALGAPFLGWFRRRRNNAFHNRLVDWDVLRLGR